MLCNNDHFRLVVPDMASGISTDPFPSMTITVQFSLFSAYHQLPILIFYTFATILRWGCVTLFLFNFVVSLSYRALTFLGPSVQVCFPFLLV